MRQETKEEEIFVKVVCSIFAIIILYFVFNKEVIAIKSHVEKLRNDRQMTELLRTNPSFANCSSTLFDGRNIVSCPNSVIIQ